MKQHKSKKVKFIFCLHIHILSERVYVIVVNTGELWGDYVHVVKFIRGGGGGLCPTYTKMSGGGGGGGLSGEFCPTLC